VEDLKLLGQRWNPTNIRAGEPGSHAPQSDALTTRLYCDLPGRNTGLTRQEIDDILYIGNESVTKIIINDTTNLFLQLQSAFW